MYTAAKQIAWEKVFVFISSTFNDMHAERDYLVKRVFPELQDWCERRKLRLVDIDLRWGVTEQDATHNKNVVKVCLNRIDDCRPFFLCFLGQRRGWVPKASEVSAETFDEFPDLRRVAGASSVTELEITHALINPLHASLPRDPERTPEYYEPAKYAFFYLRNESYLDELPADPPQLLETYTNGSIEDAAEREQYDRALKTYRDVDIPRSGRPFHLYKATWDPSAVTPEIMLPLECPSAEPANIERWQLQWQKAGVTARAPNIEADSLEARKAKRFNNHLSTGRLSNFKCAREELSRIIIEELQGAITQRFPDHGEVDSESELQKEIDQQEQFLFAATDGFIERQGDFLELDDYVDGDSNKLFVLTAPGGMGKSTLLANWVDRYRRRIDAAKGQTIHFRFIGQSDGTTTVYSLLRLLFGEIKAVAHKIDEEIALDPVRLRNSWPALLEAVGKRGKTVIVIDALNQLESGLADVGWLPRQLPDNIKLIVSFKRGDPSAEELHERFSQSNQVRLFEVKAFANLDDRRRLVRAYLSQYLKELDAAHLEALINSRGAESPLYLKVVLSELRVFGAHGNLAAKVHSDFGDNPISAFLRVLERLEDDPAYSPIDSRQAVPLLFGFLANARRGLSVAELTSLLIRALGLEETEVNREAAGDTVNLFLRQVRSFLARREGRYDFFFESFKTAAQRRYVSPGHRETTSRRSHQEWHRLLANYFSSLPTWKEHPYSSDSSRAKQPTRRKVTELPHHLIQARMLDDVEGVLCNLDFVSAKCAAALVFELQEDYHNAIAALPEAQATLGEQRDREKSLARWTNGIIRYSRLWSERSDRNKSRPLKLPKLPDSCRMWSDEEIASDCRRITDNPTRLDRLTLFASFISAECYPLLQFARIDGFVAQHVWGQIPRGPVHDAAAEELAVCQSPVLLRRWPQDAVYNPRPALLFTLEGHSAEIKCVSVTPDGRRAVSGSGDKTLKFWDLETGACLRTLEGHVNRVRSVCVTPDGRHAISGSDDSTLRVWDLETGICLRTLEGHRKGVSGVSVTPDGLRAISGSDDTSLRVWDIETGTCLHKRQSEESSFTPREIIRWKSTKRGCSHMSDREVKRLIALERWNSPTAVSLNDNSNGSWFSSVSVTADGRRAVSSGEGGWLPVWDLETGECYAHTGHRKKINSVTVTPDGQRIVSASDDRTVRVWNFGFESERWILEGHKNAVTSVSVTPDGSYAVSGSSDKTLRVWDLETGACLRTLEGHSRPVNCVSVTADGRLAVSGSDDNTLRVWNLESGASPRTDEGHHRGHAAWTMTVTPDHRLAISGSRDHRLRIWDLHSGKCLRSLEGHKDWVQSVIVTPDGKRTVSASADNTLRVWDLTSGKCLRTLKGHKSEVRCCCLTADGRRLVSGGNDNTLRVWLLETGACLRTLQGHTEVVETVSVSPDGKRAISGSADNTLRVWDIESGACLHTLEGHTKRVRCVSVTPDGHRAVSTSGDNTLRVWDLDSGACLHILEGHTKEVITVSVTPDGRRSVSSSEDTNLRVWDLETGKCLHTLEGHSRLIRSVSVTSDGKRAVSVSDDKTTRVWDIASGRCLALHVARTEVVSLALAGLGNLICAGTEGGEMLFRDVHGIEPGPNLTADASDAGYELLLRRSLESARREKGNDHEKTLAHLDAIIIHLQKRGESNEAGEFVKERDQIISRRDARKTGDTEHLETVGDTEHLKSGFLHYEELHSQISARKLSGTE